MHLGIHLRNQLNKNITADNDFLKAFYSTFDRMLENTNYVFIVPIILFYKIFPQISWEITTGLKAALRSKIKIQENPVSL